MRPEVVSELFALRQTGPVRRVHIEQHQFRPAVGEGGDEASIGRESRREEPIRIRDETNSPAIQLQAKNGNRTLFAWFGFPEYQGLAIGRLVWIFLHFAWIH